MRSITTFDLQYAHRFYGFMGEAQYLHGHTGVLTIEVEDSVNMGVNMVYPCNEIQKVAWDVLKNFDHALILREDDPLLPAVLEVYEKQGAIYQNIAIPVSDGKKMLTMSVNLKKAYESEGREIARTLMKNITLYQIDEHWKEHLRDMDDLKQSVQNATYEQKDPLLIYKFESFNLFSQMLEDLNKDVL